VRDQNALLKSFYEAMFRADRWLAPFEFMPADLATSETDDRGFVRWSPVRQRESATDVEKMYAKLPGRLPRLFEACLASFRWLRVEVAGVEFFAHPPGPDCEEFISQVLRDKHLFPTLLQNRFVEFGKAAGGSYDPVCFDLSRTTNHDCPVVRIDHESVLIDGKPKIIAEMARTFRAFVESAT
jgi:hypothetical protein